MQSQTTLDIINVLVEHIKQAIGNKFKIKVATSLELKGDKCIDISSPTSLCAWIEIDGSIVKAHILTKPTMRTFNMCDPKSLHKLTDCLRQHLRGRSLKRIRYGPKDVRPRC